MKRTQTVGRTMAQKRRMCGLTQHEVARLTGIALNRLVWFETNRIDLEPAELGLIRQVLKARARETAAAVGA